MASNNNDSSENAVVCHVCGHKNLVGALVCDNCGSLIGHDIRKGTRNLADYLPEFKTNPVFTTSGTGTFQSGMQLRIDIVGQTADIKIDPTRHELVVGRRDVASRHRPEIDLEDYEGYRLGVSRKHAVFNLQDNELTLQDFGSANGTYLNGVRLPAHRAHKLHDGDEIRMGRLTMRVYFVS